jgi:hypothetical protein
MRLEVIPSVPARQEAALRRALEGTGARLDGRPETTASAWSRAAAREAVDNQPTPVGQALSPRSTRGATRA